jgi:hypothetical protein
VSCFNKDATTCLGCVSCLTSIHVDISSIPRIARANLKRDIPPGAIGCTTSAEVEVSTVSQRRRARLKRDTARHTAVAGVAAVCRPEAYISRTSLGAVAALEKKGSTCSRGGTATNDLDVTADIISWLEPAGLTPIDKQRATVAAIIARSRRPMTCRNEDQATRCGFGGCLSRGNDHVATITIIARADQDLNITPSARDSITCCHRNQS